MTSIEIVLSFSGVHLIQDALAQCASEGWRGEKKMKLSLFGLFTKLSPSEKLNAQTKALLKSESL